MNFLDELKFITDDNKEYFVAEKKVIDNEVYCMAINLNDNTDIIYACLETENSNLTFDIIEDEKIIDQLRMKFIKN